MRNKKKHILIVDDSQDQQFLMKTLLEASGYTTECTSNGEEALVLLKSHIDMPQLILLDLNLPVMDGFVFRSIQRDDPMLKDIPIVIISGEENTQSIRDRTNVEVLKKPVGILRLLETIDSYL